MWQAGDLTRKQKDTSSVKETSVITETEPSALQPMIDCLTSNSSAGRSRRITWTLYRLTLLSLLVAWYIGCYWLLAPER
jgi:hypothetical protein